MNSKPFIIICLCVYIFCSPEHALEGPFYLKGRRKFDCRDAVWFEKNPIGKNTLDGLFKKMCKQAGLKGNYSNHSRRVTAVTRMYDAGVPEQAIMKRSGHKSIEGVRTYQREDKNEKSAVSNVLSGISDCFEITSVDDEALVNACIDYEKTVNPTVNFGGILQGANVQNVSINININK